MPDLITGLHHITALTSDAQKNLDFYAGILGLRLVKKTINFDAPEVYHLYYGNEKGSPGTIMTFFPYPGMVKGRKGNGQVTVTSFSVGKNTLPYWSDRLARFKVSHTPPKERFGDNFIYFEDTDGLGVELVETSENDHTPYTSIIPKEFAIKGFFGITLTLEESLKTTQLLTEQMNHVLIGEEDGRYRFVVSGRKNGFIDIFCQPDALIGRNGAGTIHHVAFATKDDQTQGSARDLLAQHGFNVTPVIDREYFHSVYFREPGGVLFELATENPGFAVDEDFNHLGETLKLPPWQEPYRKTIERALPLITLDPSKFKEI